MIKAENADSFTMLNVSIANRPLLESLQMVPANVPAYFPIATRLAEKPSDAGLDLIDEFIAQVGLLLVEKLCRLQHINAERWMVLDGHADRAARIEAKTSS